MASVEDRPYAGTWKLNNRQVVKYTPDALVFLNGDTSLPGCPRCRGRVRIQDYVTSLSVEAGTAPTSHSATIQLSLPRVQGQQVFVDGYNILRVGLEVNIFMRGYFQVRGMFRHLPDPQEIDEQQGTNISTFPNPTENDKLDLSKYATYPYYPVFHGVVTQVTYEYSDGFYTGTLQCASLLHFWQYQNIATASAWMAQDKKPNNDPGRPTLQGHNFNNMHPFGIIYTLYRDVAGAASGVEYALSEESNLDPANIDGSVQVYDQMTLYWTQRFKTRIQNLRMYGVNGQLFNSAQQAWLGSASNRDVDGLLPSATYNDPGTTRTEKDPTSARWSVAKALGLASAGADFVYSPLINREGELVSLSVLDMFAFSQSIAEFGVGNVWQSTYQTKLDMAQAVTEVTGYEFYQDVDGDIVFKPPFYNLDTATNRYYRLEDQDIINITFTEKEPTATFIIVRGTWFQGISDVVPNTGPTTNRGLYIDYKLVAQFGWRPAPTLDITYATDPKILFWIGVARLDMLNVDTFSASCTIPIRPELRPGYPIYIPFADSYYYASQISHSFAFGGQCTTNLVLTCRRSKWHAPGFLKAMPSVTGNEEGAAIDSAVNLIRLDRPDLPKRPLQVYDQGFTTGQGVSSGVPRIIGFPNVVMALDPRKMNPNYTVIGLGIEFLDQTDGDASLLFSMLQRDVDLLDAFEAIGFTRGADGQQNIEDPTQIKRFKLRYSSNPDRYIEFNLTTLSAAVFDYQNYRSETLGYKKETTKQTRALEQAINSENTYSSLDKQGTEGLQRSGDVSSERDKLGNIQAQVDSANRSLDQSRAGEPQDQGINLLANIFEALQPTQNKPIRRRVEGIAGSDVTMSYFETLSHLKTQYVANTIPGHYRYYSSAHPNPEMQGQPVVIFDDGTRGPSGQRTGTPRGRRARDRRKFASGNKGALSQVPATPISTSTNRATRNQDEAQNLQDRFDALGITWTTPAHALDDRNDGFTRNPDLTASQVKATPLTEDIAQGIASVAEAAQVLSDRLAARPDFGGRGFSLGNAGSWWRPDSKVEDTSSDSMHAYGVAIDLGASGPGIRRPGKGVQVDDLDEPSQTAYNAIKQEAAIMYQEGLISGLGFYEARNEGTRKPFVHIDLRHLIGKGASRWSRNNEIKPSRTDASLRASCQENVPNNVDACVAGAIDARNRAAQTLVDMQQFAQTATGMKRRGTNASYPLQVLTPEPEEGAAPQPPAVPPPPPEPQPVASLTTRDISLDTPRKVVQFKPKVSAPEPNRLPPEAELTLGNCVKGLNIAQGPERTPKILTTDQIQTISFIRYESSKFAQVVGTSSTAGSKSFREIGFFDELANTFAEAGQGIQASSITVADGFMPAYEQIAAEVMVIEVPAFDENGDPVDPPNFVLLDSFEDAVTINSELLAPNVQDELGMSGDVSLSGLTFDQLSTAQGYASSGRKMDDGQSAQDTIQRVANAYAQSVQRQITEAFNDAKASALEPADGRDERLAAISDAFNQISSVATGDISGGAQVEDNYTEQKAGKEGKIDKPLHAPVFPVSDEKGYEHYGAYRYGRGLSVEPGGTFEFIHSGQDPFRNVTAQTAEEFLQAMLLTKEGKTTTLSNELGGIRNAAFQALQDNLETTAAAGATLANLASGNLVGAGVSAAAGVAAAVENSENAREATPTPSQQDVADAEQSILDLANTVSNLKQTAGGRDVLRELLEANGDDPQRLESPSFQITDTQFARNFANFAVNYAKSPVFKTTVSNAAYQLSDLTSHLIPRAGDSCTCRGSYADVVLEAFSRINFITVDGIDTGRDKATAYQSEEILSKVKAHTEQQLRVRGAWPEGVQPDAKAFDKAGGGTQTVAQGAPLPQSSDVPSPQDAGTVSPENPPTTADAAAGGGNNTANPNDTGFSSTEEAQQQLEGSGFTGSAEDIEFMEKILQVPQGELQRILEEQGPDGIRQLVAQREAQGGFGPDSDPNDDRNVLDRGLGLSSDDVLAALYLDSRTAQGVQYDENGNIVEPPPDLRNEGQMFLEDTTGLTLGQMLDILNSGDEAAINKLLRDVPGKQNARTLRRQVESAIAEGET
jgi:hypothetical protein